MMPVMDGITLCRQLKEDVRTSHIPVILLTAKDSLQDKEEGYEVGADSYLTKPFSASLLRSRINNLLESRKKLIAQFQTQSVPGNQADLKEKRIVIAEALSKLDNEFIEKITLLIEENLSTLVVEGKAAYGYNEGTSMACPHVSGVAALGLSYALQQRRHFKVQEFINLMKQTARKSGSSV